MQPAPIVPIHSIGEFLNARWLLSDDRLDKFATRSPHEEDNIIEIFEVDNGTNTLLNRFTRLSRVKSLEPFTRCLSVFFCLLGHDFECVFSHGQSITLRSSLSPIADAESVVSVTI